jgi:hypothetical protein
VRRLALGGAIAIALLATACSSGGPSAAQGAQTASQARRPVAREYWDVLNNLRPVLSSTLAPGYGSFGVCPVSSGQPEQVDYDVSMDAVAQNGNLSPSQFVAVLEQNLRSHGWSSFTISDGYLVSSNGKFHVYLKQQTGNLAFAVVLTVKGPCVTTGTAFASQVDDINGLLHDEYPYSEASARPVPTGPLPSP